MKLPAEIPASARERCAPPAVSRITRAETCPIAVGAGNGAVRARRHHRHRGAPDGPMAVERLGQPFVVETGRRVHNDRDRGGRTGARHGYTLLLVTTASAINATLFENKLNYNFLRRHRASGGHVRVPNVMVVTIHVSARTVPELIAYAEANPGKIEPRASPGAGTSSHLAGSCLR